MRRAALALALAFLAPRLAAARPPAFTVLPLGAYGGGFEGNLSSFAVKPAGAAEYRVVLDAGTLSEGIARHLGTRDFREVERFLLGIDDYLISHSHLDHVSGMVLVSPSFFRRDTPVRVRAGRPTLDALRTHVFRDGVWADFFAMGKMAALPLEPGPPVEVGPFRVRAVPLDHPAPSQGYVLEAADGSAMVHMGDTGPTEGPVPVVRELLAAGKLRALTLECSFPNALRKLSIQTGHLTPNLLARQLHRFAFGRAAPGEGPLPAATLARIGEALRGVAVLVHHVKPEGEREIRKELAALRKAGLPLVGLHQGREVSF